MRKKNRLYFLIISIVMIYVLSLLIPKIMRNFYPIEYIDIIKKYSCEYKIDPLLVLSIMKVESNFNARALSKKEAMGLMQIKDSTGEWIAQKIKMDGFESEMLYEPDINIKLACWFIDYLMNYYDENLQLVVAAYNAGQGNVNKWLKDSELSDGYLLKEIPFSETRHYVKKVKRTYDIYKKIYNNQRLN